MDVGGEYYGVFLNKYIVEVYAASNQRGYGVKRILIELL